MAKQLYALPATTVFTLIYGIMLIVSCQAAQSKDPKKEAIAARQDRPRDRPMDRHTLHNNDPKKEAITARPDPWERQVLPPQPRLGYYKFVGDCVDKLTKPCGLQIFDSIYGKAVIIDKPCCQRMKEMGQLCSKALALTLGTFKKYKSDATFIFKKSDELFDKCVKDTATSKTK